MKEVVMLLANPFRPDPRVYKEARTLVEGGYDVTVVAWDRERKYAKKEVIDKIAVERIRVPSTYDNLIDFILKLPLFWLMVFFRIIKKKPDLIHCHDFDTLGIGIISGKMMGKKVIYDVHDNYAEMIRGSVPRVVANFVTKLEHILVRYASKIITAHMGVAMNLRRYGVKDVELVLNCKEVFQVSTQKRELIRKKLGAENKTMVIYMGMLEPGRSIEELIQIFNDLESNNILLVIGGYGSLVKKVQEKVKNSRNVKFLGWVPLDEVYDYTTAADIMVAIRDPSNENYRLSYPIKLFDAMAAGKPIIVSNGTLASDIVHEEECGIAIDYGDGEAFLRALNMIDGDKKLYDRMSRNGIRATKEKYSWKVMGERLINAYEYLGDD